MNLRILLVVHAVITLAAGVVLVVAPGAIPSVIGVHLAPGSFVLCYFLAGAEFSIAFISFYGSRCRDAEAIRLVVQTIIVFHAATAVLEVCALAQGMDVRLWGNVVLRVIVIALFAHYGKLKPVQR
jgi:F0F1-type ATP synthase assembly protein I